MTKRVAVTMTIDTLAEIEAELRGLDAPYTEALRSWSLGKAGADAALDEIKLKRASLETHKQRLTESAAVLQQDREAQRQRAEAAERERKQAAFATLMTTRYRQAAEFERDMQAGVLHLSKVAGIMESAREAYRLHGEVFGRELRSARACPERFGEWLSGRLGLPTPGIIPHERKVLSLAALLGLGPVKEEK